MPKLRRSLEKSHPRDSIVRKLYALIAGCLRQLGQTAEALATCREGLGVCPNDAELLFVEAMLRRDQGDLAGADTSLVRLLESRPDAHFASVDAGLRGYKARNNLAVIRHELGRPAEAEKQWRTVLAERPDFLPAWLGLGELYLQQARWDELERAARQMEADARAPVEAAVFRARAHLARCEFAAAQALLRQAMAAQPGALWPQVVLSHALLQEGRDLDAAEQALRDVLALDAGNAEARNNLSVLLRNRERTAADRTFSGLGLDSPPPPEVPEDPVVVETNPVAAAVWELAPGDESGGQGAGPLPDPPMGPPAAGNKWHRRRGPGHYDMQTGSPATHAPTRMPCLMCCSVRWRL